MTLKASEFLTPNEILKVKWILKFFNGKVVRVTDEKQYTKERSDRLKDAKREMKVRRWRR